MPKYKITTGNNDLILSETLKELIAMYAFQNNETFDLHETEKGMILECENKPADIPELEIKFEEM